MRKQITSCDFCQVVFLPSTDPTGAIGIGRINGRPELVPTEHATFHLCKPCLEGIGGLSRIAPAPLVHVQAPLVPSYQWPSNFQAVSGSQDAHVKPRMKPQDV